MRPEPPGHSRCSVPHHRDDEKAAFVASEFRNTVGRSPLPRCGRWSTQWEPILREMALPAPKLIADTEDSAPAGGRVDIDTVETVFRRSGGGLRVQGG
jgi:hypothetical protein